MAARRYTTHKKRAGWFQARASWPFREADVHTLVAQRERPFARPRAAAAWEFVGPLNVGGRCTSIVCHPSNAEEIWIGSAGGGVWYSADGGRHWTAQWRSQASLNIGSLAIDGANPQVLYCGTGEANLSADSYPGVGIFRTTDGGANWVLWAKASEIGIPKRIGTIAIDPFDSRHIRIGGVSHADDAPAGMFFTKDGGASWQRDSFVSDRNYFCHAVLFDSTQRGLLYATVNERGSKNGIWKSDDGGRAWKHLSAGLPDPSTFGRTSLAIAPSDPKVLYALAAAGDGVLGVFRSNDHGDHWTSIGSGRLLREGQMSYGNTIAVHPTDANMVLCGGVDLYRTTNGGATWKRATRWDMSPGDANYAHADHHALLMPASAPGVVYNANDGGLDRSDDGGRKWSNRSMGLAVTMYYDLDVAPTDAKRFGGGTQDNGTHITTTGGAADHAEWMGGDGGWMVFQPSNARKLLASAYNFDIGRFGANPNTYEDASPPAPKAERNSIWMCYITFDPNKPKRVFTASQRVWRTDDIGTTWTPVSPPLDGSPVTAIEVAPANSKHVFVGTENGGVFRSRDGGATWSGNLAGAVLPGRLITRIETHPANADDVVVTVAGRGGSHVFRSGDGALTWRDIDEGRLPGVPHSAAVIRRDEPGSIYVANDAGVFKTTNGGAAWTSITSNLPNVMVVDLVYHEATGTLWAATYGRGIWRLSLRSV
ncbi:MAG: hypothetical protein U0Q16_00440 [Bryobacteraceae bacterium]